jgi:coronin-1B/1C/6
MPKRGVNMHQNEVVRIYKSVNDTWIEPVSFIVPRRAESFQDDIYPPTLGLKPAMSPAEWLNGKDAVPPKISMAGLFDGSGLHELAAVEAKPSATTTAPAPRPAEPVQAPEPVSELAPEPTVVARPVASIKEQGASVAAMVNKYADEEDNDNVEEVDDSSSFEEVAKPTERVPASVPSLNKAATPVESVETPLSPTPPTPIAAPSSAAVDASASSTGSAVHDEIREIKALIAEQTKTIASQARQMQNLTAEIESLKSKLE